MARNRNTENAVRTATQRKWYARAWWVGVHVYGYVVLGVKGAFSPQALPITQFVLYLVVAVVTIGCYVVLQCSSPGQLEKRPLLAPVQTSTPMDLVSPSQIPVEDDDDTELLADGTENEHPRNSADLHFCNECHVFQPLRTKHWCDHRLHYRRTGWDLYSSGILFVCAVRIALSARGSMITSACNLKQLVAEDVGSKFVMANIFNVLIQLCLWVGCDV